MNTKTMIISLFLPIQMNLPDNIMIDFIKLLGLDKIVLLLTLSEKVNTLISRYVWKDKSINMFGFSLESPKDIVRELSKTDVYYGSQHYKSSTLCLKRAIKFRNKEIIKFFITKDINIKKCVKQAIIYNDIDTLNLLVKKVLEGSNLSDVKEVFTCILNYVRFIPDNKNYKNVILLILDSDIGISIPSQSIDVLSEMISLSEVIYIQEYINLDHINLLVIGACRSLNINLINFYLEKVKGYNTSLSKVVVLSYCMINLLNLKNVYHMCRDKNNNNNNNYELPRRGWLSEVYIDKDFILDELMYVISIFISEGADDFNKYVIHCIELLSHTEDKNVKLYLYKLIKYFILNCRNNRRYNKYLITALKSKDFYLVSELLLILGVNIDNNISELVISSIGMNDIELTNYFLERLSLGDIEKSTLYNHLLGLSVYHYSDSLIENLVKFDSFYSHKDKYIDGHVWANALHTAIYYNNKDLIDLSIKHLEIIGYSLTDSLSYFDDVIIPYEIYMDLINARVLDLKTVIMNLINNDNPMIYRFLGNIDKDYLNDIIYLSLKKGHFDIVHNLSK